MSASLAGVVAAAPLAPSPDEGRGALRRELLRPEYNEQDLIGRLLRWVDRVLQAGIDVASTAPPLSTLAAMLVFALLAVGLIWLVSRARTSARAPRPAGAALTDETVSAAELRRRAEAALARAHHEEALVEAFRALAVRQVETRSIDDLPGATAREIATLLAEARPDLQGRVVAAARAFDLVHYGGRSATREQAVTMLALDDDLVGVR